MISATAELLLSWRSTTHLNTKPLQPETGLPSKSELSYRISENFTGHSGRRWGSRALDLHAWVSSFLTAHQHICRLFSAMKRWIQVKSGSNKAIVDYTSPALCTAVTLFPTIGDVAYRQHAGGRPSHGHRQHARKFGKKSRVLFRRYPRGQTDTQTDILITILRNHTN